MNRDVIITCAITGAGDTQDKHPDLPITPEQIAVSALGAAEAGAAIVHLHVRDPATGKGSRDVDLYRRVVDLVKADNTDVIISLTAGMGGDLMGDACRTPTRRGIRSAFASHHCRLIRTAEHEGQAVMARRKRNHMPMARLTTPMVREHGVLRAATWDEALDRAASGFRRTLDTIGATGIGMFSCSKSTNEMNFAAQKFARLALGTNNIDSCNRT